MPSQTEVKIRKVVTKMLNTSASINRQFKNPSRKHLFLSGVHAPMHEELSLDDLTVTGAVSYTHLTLPTKA